MATVATNPFESYASSPTASPTGAVLITPDDDNDLTQMVRAITIGTAGDLEVTFVNGDTVIIPEEALAVGVQHMMQVVRVLDTNTTATNIVGWY